MSSLSAIADIEQQQREEQIWAHPDHELVPPPVKAEEDTLGALTDWQVSFFLFFLSIWAHPDDETCGHYCPTTR